MGVDGVPTEVLKKFMNILTPAILHIDNLCLTQSIYLEVWKIGLTSPIPKKGDLQECSNWKLIVSICVLEKIMNDQISEFLKQFLLEHPFQHAYQKGNSCVSPWTEER